MISSKKNRLPAHSTRKRGSFTSGVFLATTLIVGILLFITREDARQNKFDQTPSQNTYDYSITTPRIDIANSIMSSPSMPLSGQMDGNLKRDDNYNAESFAKILGLGSAWKARNIELKSGQTVAYRFGEGNPPEAFQLTKREAEAFEACGVDGHPNSLTGCPPDGYVSRDVEIQLEKILSSASWGKILSLCKDHLLDGDIMFSSGELHYRDVVTPGFLDINNWLMVNPDSGRKEVARWLSVKTWLVANLYNGGDQNGGVDLTVDECMYKNGAFHLAEAIDKFEQKLYTPHSE